MTLDTNVPVITFKLFRLSAGLKNATEELERHRPLIDTWYLPTP